MADRLIHNGRFCPDGRVIGDFQPCQAVPRHNTVETLDGECFLCAQEREWQRMLAAGERQMRYYSDWSNA